MKKLVLLLVLVLINFCAWGQSASSHYVASLNLANATLTDENWVGKTEELMPGMNEIARMFNTGVVQYEIYNLNILEE
ncbi:MAG: hypothetical protein FWD78_04425 [Treponema sp.]|nr:hypothetical protein [Treponema sp.]